MNVTQALIYAGAPLLPPNARYYLYQAGVGWTVELKTRGKWGFWHRKGVAFLPKSQPSVSEFVELARQVKSRAEV